MTNPEHPVAAQSSNALGNEKHLPDNAEAFCRIMERLNAVSFQQTEGLLNLAIRAAETFHSLHSLNSPTTAAAAPAGSSEFVDRMKTVADDINQESRKDLREIGASVKTADFQAALEQALTNAVQNSVSCQQQLNVIGTAILSQSAELLLQQDRAGK